MVSEKPNAKRLGASQRPEMTSIGFDILWTMIGNIMLTVVCNVSFTRATSWLSKSLSMRWCWSCLVWRGSLERDYKRHHRIDPDCETDELRVTWTCVAVTGDVVDERHKNIHACDILCVLLVLEKVRISFDRALKVKCHNVDASAKQKKLFCEFEEQEGHVVVQELHVRESSAEKGPMLAFQKWSHAPETDTLKYCRSVRTIWRLFTLLHSCLLFCGGGSAHCMSQRGSNFSNMLARGWVCLQSTFWWSSWIWMQRQNDVEDVSDGIIEDIEVYVAFVVDVAGSTR